MALQPVRIVAIIPPRLLFASFHVAKNPHAAKKRGKFAWWSKVVPRNGEGHEALDGRLSWLTVIAAALCAAGMTGCNSFQTSGIDPSGEHIFLPPPPPATVATAATPDPQSVERAVFRRSDGPVALGRRRRADRARPDGRAVGSEVVLIAGVLGPDGYLRTNRRLEWSIAPGSVGEFVAVEQGTGIDLLLATSIGRTRSAPPRPSAAPRGATLGSTEARATPEDDVFVAAAKAGSPTSPLEGTSQVTVVAPEVYHWDARIKSATAHWVDAVVQYPPPAINPAGTKPRVHDDGDAAHEPIAVRELDRSVRDRRGPPAGFLPERWHGDGSSHQSRRPSMRRNPPEAGGLRRQQNLYSSDPAPRCARRGRPEARDRQRHDNKDVVGADLAVRVTGPATGKSAPR